MGESRLIFLHSVQTGQIHKTGRKKSERHSPFASGSWGCHWYPPPSRWLCETGGADMRSHWAPWHPNIQRPVSVRAQIQTNAACGGVWSNSERGGVCMRTKAAESVSCQRRHWQAVCQPSRKGNVPEQHRGRKSCEEAALGLVWDTRKVMKRRGAEGWRRHSNEDKSVEECSFSLLVWFKLNYIYMELFLLKKVP